LPSPARASAGATASSRRIASLFIVSPFASGAVRLAIVARGAGDVKGRVAGASVEPVFGVECGKALARGVAVSGVGDDTGRLTGLRQRGGRAAAELGLDEVDDA